ncbi:hypothetical protein L7F22_053340 [Adiantum nelumboides]|nr:hypothetical protein [Adiantum nelumboides]
MSLFMDEDAEDEFNPYVRCGVNADIQDWQQRQQMGEVVRIILPNEYQEEELDELDIFLAQIFPALDDSSKDNSEISFEEELRLRAQLRKQLETTRNQKEKLEALCRTMQAERKQHSLAIAGVAASAAASGAITAAAAFKPEQVQKDDSRDNKMLSSMGQT